MIGIRTIWIYLFALMSFSNFCEASSRPCAFSGEVTEEKYYVTLDQIVLTEEGMFLVTDKGFSLITQLNWEENGYYTGNVELKKCYNDHPQVCLDCHGCGNKKCIWCCRCIGGPRQD